MKKLNDDILLQATAGGSPCAEAIGGSVVVLASRTGFVTLPLTVAAGKLQLRGAYGLSA